MLFYLSLFLLFIVIYKYAERSESWFLLLIAILIPALFEGLRDDFVGEDMLGYGGQWFDDMDETGSIWDMFYFSHTPEYAYHLIIYICKIISPDIHLYMTVCALIKMSAVSLFAFRMREEISTVLFLFSYYCFFYVTGFSLMRQGVAVAICIYSLVYFMNNNLLMFLLTVAIAYFFHNSAILMLLLIPIYYMRNMKYKYPIILGGILFVYFSVEMLFELVLMTPFFKSEMADLYLDSGVDSAKTNLLLSFVFLSYAVYQHVFGDENTKERTFVLMISSALSLFFVLLSSYIEVAFRMSYYMFIVSLLMLLMFINESDKPKRILVLSYISLFLLHFYIGCKHGLAGALDYSSAILGIGGVV